MTTDLLIGTDLDTEVDGANDLATVSGLQQLEQSVAIDVLSITRQFIGTKITGEQIGLLEERVRQSLADDEQLGTILDVIVREYDETTNEITMEVVVLENEDFDITISNFG